ncbi:MAG: acyl-CoA dehydrogenase family protein [Microbacterium sp.]
MVRRDGTEAAEYGLPPQDQELISASLEVRERLQMLAPAIDAAGTYPFGAIEVIEQSALHALSLPESAGGLAPQKTYENLPTMVQVWKNLGAGESSTAQVWAFSQGLSAQLLGERSPLPPASRDSLLRAVGEGGIRFCSPNAERYRGRRFNYEMAIRRTDGGVLVNGTKYFATGSPGSRYAHSIGLMEGFADVFSGGRYNVLIDLDSDGVELRDDWDNMGQRATCSNTVTYHDVFVPDGYHWDSDAEDDSDAEYRGLVLPFSLTAILLGIGEGAVDALAEHLRTRATYEGVLEDKGIRQQLGQFGARLVAAEAALMDAARRVQLFCTQGVGARGEISVRISAAKIAIVEAVIGLSSEMHKFMGGQSSSNAFRYDRFWRNARTLSVQDVMDVRVQQVGAWFLSGEEPAVTGLT